MDLPHIVHRENVTPTQSPTERSYPPRDFVRASYHSAQPDSSDLSNAQYEDHLRYDALRKKRRTHEITPQQREAHTAYHQQYRDQNPEYAEQKKYGQREKSWLGGSMKTYLEKRQGIAIKPHPETKKRYRTPEQVFQQAQQLGYQGTQQALERKASRFEENSSGYQSSDGE